MKRTPYTIIVVVVTIVAMLILQGIVHHLYPPAAPRTKPKVQKPLAAQQAAESQQAARDFFTALKDSDWDTITKSWPPDTPKGKQFNDVFTDRVKSAVTGLEIVSIGTPYKETGNGWVMIPYEVDFKGGGSQTNSLRMMKGSGGQWIWGGGF